MFLNVVLVLEDLLLFVFVVVGFVDFLFLCVFCDIRCICFLFDMFKMKVEREENILLKYYRCVN